MKPTTGYALPYSDDRCFFLNKELYAFFIQTREKESFRSADITLAQKGHPIWMWNLLCFISFHSQEYPPQTKGTKLRMTL